MPKAKDIIDSHAPLIFAAAGDPPTVSAIATTAAFGIGAAGVIVASRPMTRREVIFHLLGGAILAASVPQVVAYYANLPPVVNFLLGVACGFTVPLLVGWIQKAVKQKTETMPEIKP